MRNPFFKRCYHCKKMMIIVEKFDELNDPIHKSCYQQVMEKARKDRQKMEEQMRIAREEREKNPPKEPEIEYKHCVICNGNIEPSWFDPQSFCRTCMANNKERLSITENIEKFKTEANALFYMTIGDVWAVDEDETKFFMHRWGIWKD